MTRERRRGRSAAGPELTVVYWRDIPAQVIASADGGTAKRELGQRFQEAIDISAMLAGGRDSDAYLADWRRSEPQPCEADLDAAVTAAAERLERDYDPQRLARLIESGGRDQPEPPPAD